MIIAGIKLSLLGMGIVIVFLFLIYCILLLSGKLLSSYSAAELVAEEEIWQKKQKKAVPLQENRRLIAVIGAAVRAYRSRARVKEI